MLRSATAADIDTVLTLCELRPLPDMPIRGLSGAEITRHRLENYRLHAHMLGQSPDLDVLLATDEGGVAAGFVAVTTGIAESITHEPQTLIFDFALRSDTAPSVLEALLDGAAAFARRHGDEYLVVQLPPGDPHETAFARAGFMLDMVRVAKKVRPPEPEALPGTADKYQVRLARESDHLFILYLSTVSSQNTVPPGRPVDAAAVKERYLQAYMALDVGQHGQAHIFVAERIEDSIPVGYFMLQVAEQADVRPTRTGYVYDIAVHPEHWGGGVSQLLIHHGERQLETLGVELLLGDISAENPRPLMVARKHLGFEVETGRWARRLA